MNTLKPAPAVCSRRRFIGAFGAALLSLGCAYYGVSYLKSPSVAPLANTRDVLGVLREMIADDDDAVALGRLFLAETELAGDPDFIGTVLRLRLDLAEPPVGENVVRDVIQRRIDEDFDTGETVLVDGWLVSVTEAMLFAYAAVTASY